jgi:release factor glutamine methyltransferase
MSDNLSDCALPGALQAWLERGRDYLRAAGRSEARLDAELLLAHALQKPRSYLLAHAEESLPGEIVARYRELLSRASTGEPLAYLTGQREFWSLPLSVTSDVLIPRPETELAVERCLALIRDSMPAARICDLGTGSGAIALALASERPHWHITATDVSAAALAVARDNAHRLGLTRIKFVAGDWFAALPGRSFDLIVSNPPYVGLHEPALAALRHEPRIALTPGADGLTALQRLIVEAREHLHAAGWLVLEHGAGQAAAVRAALVKCGYARVRCHRDLAGHDRVSEGQCP